MITKKSATLGFLLTAAFLQISALSASADVITMTWTGKVASVTGNNDSLDFFGGGNLAGDSFTVQFTFNAPATAGSATSGASGDGVFLPAVFTINNQSQSLVQSTVDSAAGASTGGNGVGDSVLNGIFDGIAGASTNWGIGTTINNGPVAPSTFAGTNTITPSCGNGCSGFGGFSVGGEDIEFTIAQETTVDTTGVTTAVPEPSTWAMMILGFFGIGTMTYRRRRHVMLAA
jgi:hypothetical protein